MTRTALPNLTELESSVHRALPRSDRRGLTAKQIAVALQKPNGKYVGRALATLKAKGLAQGTPGEEWRRA